MATIAEALTIALSHHQANRLDAAEQIYRQILAIEPNHADAWHLLGVAHYQRGNHQVATDYIRTAIGLNANVAAFHCNLGNVYHSLLQRDEAVACYRRALELETDFVEARNNLGSVLKEQGKRDEAADCYRRALELKPDIAEAHNNLGSLYRERGLWDEAVVCYRRALDLKPDSAEAHNNLGVACKDQGQWDEAVTCYRRALDLKPDFAEAHNNLGVALLQQGNRNEAAICYRKALELKPDYAEAYNNLGNAYKDQGLWDEAVACYRRALDLKPDYVEAHYNLGDAVHEQGKLDEAAACYRRALDLKPDFPVALSALVHELQHLCHWEDLNDLSQRVIEAVDQSHDNAFTTPVSPFSFLTLPTVTTAPQQLRCAQQWVDRHLKLSVQLGRNLTDNRPAERKSKIAIGYLSCDFHSHATAMLIAELFEKHDRDRFAIFGYSYGPDDGSSMRRRLVKGFDRFVDLRGTSFTDAARRIAADEVDILIDLKGYTQDARTQILALRPAPIQVNYLGYPGTMGASFMDYILVDEYVVPPDQQPFYTEKLVHLPGCYQVNDSRREISERTPSRAECGLPEEGFVFCCFNNNYKITPAVFDVWMQLLRAVPGSVLWLLESNRFAAANLRREALARGVAAERLVFAPWLAPPEHIARHRLGDLFLDTVPVNAHTTASDALWAGCPVLTIAGETFVSRVAGSLLRTLGLPELIATGLDEYEALALRLATEPEQLALLRARLQTNRTTSSLFDAGQFVETLEKAYATMWQIYASGEKPRAFCVSPT